MAKVDTSVFERRLQRWAAMTRTDLGSLAKQQFKGILRGVVMASPPGKRRGDSPGAAKKRGEKALSRDLSGSRGVFVPLHAAQLRRQHAGVVSDVVPLFASGGRMVAVEKRLFRPHATDAEMRAHHKAHWRQGKVRLKPETSRGNLRVLHKMVVGKTAFNRYRRTALKSVGRFAAGWNAAAAKVGYRPPAWIARHRSAGAIAVELSARRIRFKATNKVPYGSKLSNVRHRVQRAVNDQANKLHRQIKHRLISQAKKAGFRS